MKQVLLATFAFCCLTFAARTQAADPSADSARALIGRISPTHVAEFVCETIPADGGKDVYEIESRDGMVVLRGNSGVALASGFYHYLKEFCHCHVSWNGDQLALPSPLPTVPEKIRVVATVETKFAYNYCTHGYTMLWWDWAQWERELDWLALHGINAALIIEGQEAVWQNTFARFGYTKEEVRQWLCSPIYQPWQYMQNMQGVLPPSQALIEKRVALGQKIVRRCRELGIRPVLQGFYGMIPSGFKGKFPDARIVDQGGWAGGNRRPDMLHIADPRFVPIATVFLEEQRKLFGECHLFAADPFHEGGRPGDMKRGEVYKVVQDAVLNFDPDATVVKQCWGASNEDMFTTGNRSKSLALDLFCDVRPFWSHCNGYNGTPWVWCLLHNFGGRLFMGCNLPKLAGDFGGALADPKRGKLSGIALVPEGSHQNPVVYELMSEMGWRGAPADLHAWIGDYIHARYGTVSPEAIAAWNLMLKNNYGPSMPAAGLSDHGVDYDSVIAIAPRFEGNPHACTWSPGTVIPCDNQLFAETWKHLLAAAPAAGASDAFRFDLADVARQTLCNFGKPVYDRMAAAFAKRDKADFERQAQLFLGLLRDIDTLTATRIDWLMGKWIADARAWGGTAAEIAELDRSARLLVTTWVPNPHTDLSDYANREWNGLVGEYYLGRWSLFIDALRADLDGKAKFNQGAFNKARGEFEIAWIGGQSRLADKPRGDTVAVAGKLYTKYAPLIAEYAPKPGRLTKGAWTATDLIASKDFVWDVSDRIKEPGSYKITFQWKSGQSALTVGSVALVVNGKIVQTDEHPGWTGLENKLNSYTLKAAALPAGATVELRISNMKGASGTDSAGTITVEKAP